MKFLLLSVVLCAFVASGSAQTKSPSVFKMQKGLGDMLGLVKDLTLAVNDVMSDINVQAALNNAKTAIAGIKNLYATYGTTNSNAVSLAQRTKLQNALKTFQNNITNLETTLGQFPLSPSNIDPALKAVHNTFLALGGSIVPL